MLHAFHALALDEDRKPFSPTLWFFDQPANPDNFKQVWFTGVHSNIGGGKLSRAVKGTNHLVAAEEASTTKQQAMNANVLSDGSLIWMIAQVKSFLEFDIEFLHCDIRAGSVSSDERARELELSDAASDRKNVWYKGPLNDNYADISSHILYRKNPRSVMGYSDPTGLTTESVTNEFLHQSVLDRSLFLRPDSETDWKDIEHVIPLQNVYWYANDNLGIPGKPRGSFGKEIEIEGYSLFELEFWRKEGQF